MALRTYLRVIRPYNPQLAEDLALALDATEDQFIKKMESYEGTVPCPWCKPTDRWCRLCEGAKVVWKAEGEYFPDEGTGP